MGCLVYYWLVVKSVPRLVVGGHWMLPKLLWRPSPVYVVWQIIRLFKASEHHVVVSTRPLKLHATTTLECLPCRATGVLRADGLHVESHRRSNLSEVLRIAILLRLVLQSCGISLDGFKFLQLRYHSLLHPVIEKWWKACVSSVSEPQIP